MVENMSKHCDSRAQAERCRKAPPLAKSTAATRGAAFGGSRPGLMASIPVPSARTLFRFYRHRAISNNGPTAPKFFRTSRSLARKVVNGLYGHDHGAFGACRVRGRKFYSFARYGL